MFQCINCSKQVARDEDEEVRQQGGTPTRKGAVKSLTAQFKDIVLKISGAHKSSSTRASAYRRGLRSLRSAPGSETNSEGGVQYPYMGGVGSGSTSPWNLNTNFGSGGRSDQRLIGGSSGFQTPPRVNEPEPVPQPVPPVPVPALAPVAAVEEQHESIEWVAQVEPGVNVTFRTLPNGGNDLRRIQFDREVFDKFHAQVWWGENFDRIKELYNVRRFNRHALHTPPPSQDEAGFASFSMPQFDPDSPIPVWLNDDNQLVTPYSYYPYGFTVGEGSSSNQNMLPAGPTIEASRSSSNDELFFNTASGDIIESDWMEQDEPGVFVTIRQFPDGTKELRRVRFSRQRFGDEEARKWWAENRERIQANYL